MPISRTFLFCLLTALSVAFTAGTAVAQDAPPAPDPEAIAEECKEKIQERTKKCVDHINGASEKAVAAITKLVEEDKPRAAYLLARRAASNISRHSHRCCASLKRSANRCAKELEELGADELADEVKAAAKSGCERIQSARADALMAIREALPERDGDGDGDGDGRRPRRR